MKRIPTNFRLSRESLKLLSAIAHHHGVSNTEVVEYCVARHALHLGIEAKNARELLLRQIAKSLAAESRKTDHASSASATEDMAPYIAAAEILHKTLEYARKKGAHHSTPPG